MKAVVNWAIIAVVLLLVTNMALAESCDQEVCYQITATEGATMYEDYWQACFHADGTGSLYSANADHTYELYLFSGGPGGYSTKKDSVGWSTWIALGSGPESTGYIWTPVFGTYLQAIGQHNGTRYSLQGIQVPCEPDL